MGLINMVQGLRAAKGVGVAARSAGKAAALRRLLRKVGKNPKAKLQQFKALSRSPKWGKRGRSSRAAAWKNWPSKMRAVRARAYQQFDPGI